MEQYGMAGGRVSSTDAARVDAAANEFLWKTYRWMSLGLAATGVTALLVAGSPAIASVVLGNSIVFYGLIIAELGLVVAFSAKVATMSPAAAATTFLAYSVINGLTLSVIFLAYTASSVAQVFFISAGSFAGLSFVGATTKRDLSAMGRFMFFGLIGLVIATVVNIFWHNPALYWISSYAGVVIFAGLTAYDNQKLKRMYAQRGETGNLALSGALTLYLDFINLFLFLLRLLGKRR